jgi:hypothetical protein
MGAKRCPQCGLVNFENAAHCKRCAMPFDVRVISESGGTEPNDSGRSFKKRIAWIVCVSLSILLLFYTSLRLTSDRLNPEQQQVVERAVRVLKDKGFDTDALVLSKLASFRTSDNWWNVQTGHHEAYAATNFPFEIVTLYPEFFDVAVDDTERAAILLHEARHLLGSGELAAFEMVWRSKGQLGWTGEHYGETRLWKSTAQLTRSNAPHLFVCGSSSQESCVD